MLKEDPSSRCVSEKREKQLRVGWREEVSFTSQDGAGGRPGKEVPWPHPGDEVLLQLLHQEVCRLLLIGLVGLQVAPGLLGAGVKAFGSARGRGACLGSSCSL